MSCCGGKREALAQRRPYVVTASPTPVAVTRPRTPVLFKGIGKYLVTGPHSREVYSFSADEPKQLVDARDAAVLIRSGLFRGKL